MLLKMNIRPFEMKDLTATSEVHKAAFIRQTRSYEWIECNSKAYPKSQIFVAENHKMEIIGYIHWCQKSGFRSEVVLELEQLAVHPRHKGKGIGTKLIKDSLPQVQRQLKSRNAVIKHIVVTTRSDNDAQKLYKKTLNAAVEATISSLYSADEVFMISRNIKL
ncbi:MAG: GNAT family N-acetyltransferase [Desulfobacterales bacterium]|nr:GNAT family N-acetyltransferase [Desulfobacterales bacterium]